MPEDEKSIKLQFHIPQKNRNTMRFLFLYPRKLREKSVGNYSVEDFNGAFFLAGVEGL